MGQFINRTLLFIFSLTILIVSAAVALSGLSVIDESVTLNAIRDVLEITWLNNTVIIVSFVLFLLSLRFIFVSFQVSNPRKRSFHLVNAHGEIMISMETLENLSLKAAGSARGVKDIKAMVKITEQGLDIAIRVVVDGFHPIPEITEEIQRQVSKEVSEITGIKVNNVSVFVANIIQNPSQKRRVE